MVPLKNWRWINFDKRILSLNRGLIILSLMFDKTYQNVDRSVMR